MCLIPFQCLFVGDELNLANKFTAKEMSGLVQLVRYISAPIALRYGTSGPRTSSFSSQGRYGYLSIFNDLTTIGVLKELALFILKRFKTLSGLKVKNQKIEKAGTFLLHYLIVTLRSQEKERRFLKNSSTGADLKRCERIEGKKSPHVLEKFVLMVWGRNQSQIFDEIEVLKRVVESIGTKLEPLEPKLEIARIGEEGLSRLRTRVTRVVSLDTGRVPQAEGISSLVLLYYLSNVNYSKCYRLRYDELCVSQVLTVFGNTQGLGSKSINCKDPQNLDISWLVGHIGILRMIVIGILKSYPKQLIPVGSQISALWKIPVHIPVPIISSICPIFYRYFENDIPKKNRYLTDIPPQKSISQISVLRRYPIFDPDNCGGSLDLTIYDLDLNNLPIDNYQLNNYQSREFSSPVSNNEIDLLLLHQDEDNIFTTEEDKIHFASSFEIY
ncbi:hypothetical protein LXL04_013248 [Taraxacum kok-saghyz]